MFPLDSRWVYYNILIYEKYLTEVNYSSTNDPLQKDEEGGSLKPGVKG